jgi:hypothetical protein
MDLSVYGVGVLSDVDLSMSALEGDVEAVNRFYSSETHPRTTQKVPRGHRECGRPVSGLPNVLPDLDCICPLKTHGKVQPLPISGPAPVEHRKGWRLESIAVKNCRLCRLFDRFDGVSLCSFASQKDSRDRQKWFRLGCSEELSIK